MHTLAQSCAFTKIIEEHVSVKIEPLEKFPGIQYISYLFISPPLSLPLTLSSPSFLSLSLFYFPCRYVHPKSGLVVKLDLQLYQIDHKNYLLDFHCVNPPLDEKDQSDNSSGAGEEDSAHLRHFVMEFFEICSRLIGSLAQ